MWVILPSERLRCHYGRAHLSRLSGTGNACDRTRSAGRRVDPLARRGHACCQASGRTLPKGTTQAQPQEAGAQNRRRTRHPRPPPHADRVPARPAAARRLPALQRVAHPDRHRRAVPDRDPTHSPDLPVHGPPGPLWRLRPACPGSAPAPDVRRVGAAVSQIGPDAQAVVALLHTQAGLSHGKVANSLLPVPDPALAVEVAQWYAPEVGLIKEKVWKGEEVRLVVELKSFTQGETELTGRRGP